ncbi:MAG: hypothetical protein DRI95_00060 [Bacteroidetes bacterium]|nr:MAG: hypothetical protein DRI95_00060 [Bacteroidota bacterium]
MESLYIRKIIEGDVSKFSYFVESYKNMAFSIAFRIINNTEDAEEVVQDSFLKAFKSLSKFRKDSKFSTWFYKIVVNSSLSKIKKPRLDISSDIDLINEKEVIIENVGSAYKSLTLADQKKYIDIALGELNYEERLILSLYYLNENSIEEVSEITGIKKETIKMKLLRARKKMYIVLNEKLKSETKNIL